MKILSPSIMRLEKPLETCAKVMDSLGCNSVHIDIAMDVQLPGFYGKELLASRKLELFNYPATIHIFTDTSLEVSELDGVRKNDRAMLHVFPHTSHDQISALMEIADRIGCEPALALDIESSVDVVVPFIDSLKAIYVMGIPAATYGLPLDKSTLCRMNLLQETILSKNSSCILGIDGGINHGTFTDIATLADEIVVGSLLFNAPNIYSQWEALNAWLKKIDGGK